jgi:ubiquinone/menaquinone biosynthesis C-methylase UbiE
MPGVQLINPKNNQPLTQEGSQLKDVSGNEFRLVKGAYRFVESQGYSANFGYQWKSFKRTQLDKFSGLNFSFNRFFEVTKWKPNELENQNILEVGCGAGRFTQVVLDHTKANLYSLDYSEAVEANYENNGPSDRLKLFQASIYEMPFAENSFDKIFCFGVLQHTPDVKKSIECMFRLLKPGGELVIDFYPYNGFWTKVNAKYMLRPFLKKMNSQQLLKLIDKNAAWMISLTELFNKIKVGKILNRFVPICDISSTLPENLSAEERREWVKLDTFDMFSPAYDRPQKKINIRNYFVQLGMKNIECKTINYDKSLRVSFCRGTK